MEKLGLIKEENGKKKIDFKKFGIFISILVFLILYALLLCVEIIPFFSFVDKPLFVDSVKFCIESWKVVAGGEIFTVGGMGCIGLLLNKKENTNINNISNTSNNNIDNSETSSS